VTGTVHPDQVLANSTVQPGDEIILTKPLGTGVMSTAQKGGLANETQVAAAVESMARLNRYAAEAMTGLDIHACTDVTGFGLAGHLLEMAKGGRMHIELVAGQVALLDGVLDYAAMGMVPAGAHKNRQFFKTHTRVDNGVDRVLTDLLFDPQTSGGLLVSLPSDQTGLYVDRLEEKGISGCCVGRVKTEHSKGFLDIC
ncbi:MAG: selenide, water dikinase SelD, partial [Desulfobacterales bacterium]|nr:selenide, water dikinase SelD [Desulfobacterales bacterium]